MVTDNQNHNYEYSAGLGGVVMGGVRWMGGGVGGVGVGGGGTLDVYKKEKKKEMVAR